MERFTEGDEVRIRYGRQQGQKGMVIKNQAADVYRVRLEDGAVLFFCGKGLELHRGPHVSPAPVN